MGREKELDTEEGESMGENERVTGRERDKKTKYKNEENTNERTSRNISKIGRGMKERVEGGSVK